MEEADAFRRLYELRDENNKWFVSAWRRLRELDQSFWAEYQQRISDNDEEITKLMRSLCE